MSKAGASGFGDAVKMQLEQVEEKVANDLKPPAKEIPSDINVLIEGMIQIARQYWHAGVGKNYARMAMGQAQVKDDRTPGHKTANDTG